jgi:ferritin
MLSNKMQEALNAQINSELYSAYLYLAMTAYFEAENLRGFANWMRVQASEEMTHAMKIYDFINERNGRVLLQPIQGPQAEWESSLAAFESAYQHEQEVTGMINRLVDLSIQESDHATQSFLQWFVDEQVEEEANAYNVIQDLKRVVNSAHGLFMLDRELAGRKAEAEGEAEAEG